MGPLGSITLEEAREAYPDSVKALEEEYRVQREYQRLYEAYRHDLVDYRRDVFVIASVLRVLAVAAGLYLYRKGGGDAAGAAAGWYWDCDLRLGPGAG